MKPVAYVQADDHGQPYSANGAVASRGFLLLGYEVRYFRPEELSRLGIDDAQVMAGGMGIMRKALERATGQFPQPISITTSLYPYLGRDCWRTTPREIRMADRYPLFIKPFEDAKVFTGQVIAGAEALDHLLSSRQGFPAIPQDFALLAQEVVHFVSEWRFFVIRGVVVGVSFYKGDPLVFPNANAVRLTLGAYQDAPAGYSADFGITEDGRTLLVEVNDGYSLGHGGLPANVYAELLEARWQELTAR